MENLTLTPEEITDLKLGEKLSLTGLYCAQCANCIPQCESNINIPVLMRSFMYVYGHKNPLKAKETLNGKDYTGRTLRVDEARPRGSSSSDNRRGGGFNRY